MRRLFALAFLLATMAVPAFAQEAERSISYKDFVKALSFHEIRELGMGGSVDMGSIRAGKKEAYASLVGLAEKDSSLAKVPTIRAKTLAILKQIDTAIADDAAARVEMDRIEKKIKLENERNQGGNSQGGINQKKIFKLSSEMTTLRNSYFTKFYPLKKSVEGDLDTLRRLETTPEGQQFAMPESAAFLAALRPYDPVMGRAAMLRRPDSDPATRFEVVSAAPEGFYGYLMVADMMGRTPRVDSAGNLRYVVDPTKNVYVWGYAKPVVVGDVVRMIAKQGEMKVINGVQVQEYVYVSE